MSKIRVKKQYGEIQVFITPLHKKLIISHHKELLNDGKSYLVDDRPDKSGSDEFGDHLIQFGSDKFPDWNAVVGQPMPFDIRKYTTPDFMYNQKVTYDGGSWTYTPVKYWPNNEGDRLSFFGYAPYRST